MNQEVGGSGANQRQSDKQWQSKTTRAKVHRNGTITHARSERPLANTRSHS